MLRAEKPMKAAMGKSVRGYGAARTWFRSPRQTNGTW